MAGGGRSQVSARAVGATSLAMASENFGYSSVRLRRVKKLQFGVVNPDELVSALGLPTASINLPLFKFLYIYSFFIYVKE